MILAYAMFATVTAYHRGCGGGAHTARGIAPEHGIVAVDRDVIPLGSRVRIPGADPEWRIAEDTGVIGRHVDLYARSCDAAVAWGTKRMRIEVRRRARRSSTPTSVPRSDASSTCASPKTRMYFASTDTRS